MSARPLLLARLAIVAALALGAAYQVVRSAAEASLVDDQPEVAARFWPGHPRVALALSMTEIGRSAAHGRPPEPQTIARAMKAATVDPLAAEPFLIKGAVALAAAQPARAERLFVEARRRDVRSAAARYFLAQLYLAGGRPVEGLAEASILSRLVPGAGDALIPGIAQYAHSPGAIANLKPLFAADPVLGASVLADLARDAGNADLVLALAGDAPKNSAGASAPPWQAQLVRSLVDKGDFARAHAVWLRMAGLRPTAPGLFNPQFAAIAAPPPFNWTLSSGDFGVAEPVAPGGLQIIYYGRADADFASQLLLLAPGDYQLRMRVTREADGDEPSGLSWSLSCQPRGRSLLVLPLAGARGTPQALGARFSVPAGCPAQLLKLSGAAREFAASEQAVIADLQLVGNAR